VCAAQHFSICRYRYVCVELESSRYPTSSALTAFATLKAAHATSFIMFPFQRMASKRSREDDSDSEENDGYGGYQHQQLKVRSM
jgi:hypothetical protein